MTGFRYGADGRNRRRGMNAGVGASGAFVVAVVGRFGSSGGGGAGASSGGVRGAGGGAVVKNPGRCSEGAPRRYVLLRVKLLHLLLLQHEFLLLLLQPGFRILKGRGGITSCLVKHPIISDVTLSSSSLKMLFLVLYTVSYYNPEIPFKKEAELSKMNGHDVANQQSAHHVFFHLP